MFNTTGFDVGHLHDTTKGKFRCNHNVTDVHCVLFRILQKVKYKIKYMYLQRLLLLTGVWGTWTEMEIDGARTFVLFLDTEAFESIGKSDVYDDR